MTDRDLPPGRNLKEPISLHGSAIQQITSDVLKYLLDEGFTSNTGGEKHIGSMYEGVYRIIEDKYPTWRDLE